MAKSILPGMSIPLPKGSPPPQYCPRCLGAPPWARHQRTFVPVSPGVRQMYIDRGLRPLAQCSGCMYVLFEVD